MLRRIVRLGTGLLCLTTPLMLAGCAHCRAQGCWAEAAPCHEEPAPVAKVADLLPPNAKPGECWVKVFVPETFETTKETVCVREASERLEIVPATYEWVEERVMVKEASARLEEVPAEFASREEKIQTDPGHTGWHIEKTAPCATQNQQVADNMYCLVSHEPVYQTVEKVVQVKPVTVREVPIPAEYTMVRRQRLATPATTRRIPIPAQFATVDKIRKTGDSRVEWQRVSCQPESRADAPINMTDRLVSDR